LRGRERGVKREKEGKKGGKGGVKEGRRWREEMKRGRRREGCCALHFFKGTVVQDFWSEFFVSNPSFGSFWVQRKTVLNKFEF
jgi:hypothetical protein